ncbi:MAG: type VI secretion system tip protein TssI/VgrG [Pseudomonadota bacterium]
MADALKQDLQVAELNTPLGKDILNVVRFDGVEGLSELFEFSLEALGERESLDFNKIIGENCTVTVKGKTVSRHYSGVLVEAAHLEASASFNTYRLVLRPWLWLLSRTSDCRIFHEMSTPDIIQDVFQNRGFNDFTIRLTEGYPTREYCVQYRETDLDFICRLMEEDGIYFYFEHENGRHTLVLADAKSSHNPVEGLSDIMYVERVMDAIAKKETIHSMIQRRSLQSGKIALNDYDYEKPSASMKSDHTNPTGHTRDDLEIYDYPGRYTETSDGDRFARVKLEAAQALDQRRQATGDAPALAPGGLIKVTDHPQASENIEYLVVRCEHHLSNQHYRSSGGGDGGDPYTGRYEFQPSDRPFRAPALTQKPKVHGPQTAKVVGADGEEIDVDELGRILVRFHWDRRNDQSRRVRVSQPWAGNQWGGIHIPRIGQEVLVEFLEADPDNPVVIGTVYNGERSVPYELPANKTKAGIKSNSSKGGSGYNEIVFEDKKNSEELGIHAQKDMNIVVLNSETREIGERFSAPTGQNSRKTTLKKGDDELELSTGKQKIDIAQSQNTKAGTEIVIEAGMKLTLKVGGSSIELTPAGITITGTAKVDINGGAMMKASAGIIKLN